MLYQSGDKVIHERIDARIVSGGCKDQFGITESVAESLGHIVSCKVIDENPRTSFGFEFFCKEIYSVSGVTIYGSIGDHDSVCLRCVGGPGVIESDIMAKIFSEYRTMKRTDLLDIKCCSNFEKRLNLFSVFSYDTDEVTSCFVIPWLLYIERTEFAETVCGKQNFFCAVISHHNFRPVYHRSKDKSKLMESKRKCTAVFYFDLASLEVEIKEVLDHVECFFVGNNCGVRINFEEVCHVCCMVRFHMLNDQVIRSASVEDLLDIVEPFMCEVGIYGIHNRDLVIQDHVRVVGHSVRNLILSFKKVNLMVIYTCVSDSICDLHISYPPICYEFYVKRFLYP